MRTVSDLDDAFGVRAERDRSAGRIALAAARAGQRDAHGGGTRCPQCGHAGATPLDELELEINPVGPVLPEMLMQHLGHAAAQARSEAEAEAFSAALVPLAARVVPRAAPVLLRATPQLVRSVAGLTRVLRREPRTRALVRVLPTAMTGAARVLARRTAGGRPVTPQAAVRTFASQADRVLRSPASRRSALRRAAILDRRYHQAACPRTWDGGAPDPLRDRGRVRGPGLEDVGLWTPAWGRT